MNKTAEQILSEHSKAYGLIEDNPRAVVLASEAVDAMKEYVKQVLEEYTNRIVKNATAKIETEWEGNTGSEYCNEYAVVEKESITSQLPLMLKKI